MSGVTAVTMSTDTPAATAAAEASTVTRPDYIPEKFWKGNVEDATKAMAASYSELEKKQSSAPKVEGTTAGTAEATPPTTGSTTTTTTTTTPAPSAEETAAVKAIETKLSTAAGSPEALTTMLEWAKANATDAQKAVFDASLDSGNPALVEMAFAPIKAAYTAAMGTQGSRVTGESVPTTVGAKPFASQHEIIKFVNSPAYKSGDKAVHAEYEARMKVTNW